MKRAAWLLVLALLPLAAPAEYGDVVLNKRAEKEGMKPVVFPHWFHRMGFPLFHQRRRYHFLLHCHSHRHSRHYSHCLPHSRGG